MSHAGGVIFKDEPFTESVSLMRTPKGEIITAYDLHDVEYCGDIKYDVLSVEALDKIHNCLDLLSEQGYIENNGNLRETYEEIIGIYNLEREDKKMWEMVWNHEIQALFQMEKESGIKGIALTKPTSVKDLATLNSVIRLMAPEKGAEQPLDMWVRYRTNIESWKNEMRLFGLTQEEIDWLMTYPDITNGIAESQECLMKLVQEEKLGGNSLNFADKCRKGLAKKDGPLFKECETEFFENAKNKNCSEKLVHYVWDVLLKVQRNYSFNKSHTLAYSLVALQEMNLAYKYPLIFWNCACLISDAGGAEDEESVNEINDSNCWEEETYYNTVEDFGAVEEEEDEDEENEEVVVKKEKKKTKTSDYGRIAAAIGKMATNGITISPPDINRSSYTFQPDPEQQTIRYGLSGIVKVGEEVVKSIIENRPYSSIDDFLSKVKITKPQMINLIKSGAFDIFGERTKIMHDYVDLISETKNRVTLQNMKMLIDFNLIPEELDFNKRVYNFNKYIKKSKLDGDRYGLDNIAFSFYESNFDLDKLIVADTESGFSIAVKDWKKIYDIYMNDVRDFIKANAKTLLSQINKRLTREVWDKYCLGNLSKWEMDSVSFYSHNHELSSVNNSIYGISNYFDLSQNPQIDRIINVKGKQIPLMKIHRIAGTVLDKDSNKKTVTLLTTSGVVTVKIYGGIFSNYDKQISERGADGKKHVVEKSWFQRGNKIIISGIRQEDTFLAKKYKSTPWHLVELITDINSDGTLVIKSERTVLEED